MFNKKQDKIYKIVYEPRSWSRVDTKTLLVTARDPAGALKEFYRIIGTDVCNITEFIEVIPKKEVETIEKS